MGVQRKRRRREERLEEEEEQQQAREPAAEEKEKPREKEPTAADRVLDLQKTAGNRATTAAISRWGFPRLPAATAAPQWPKEAQVIVDGEAIPITSFSWPDARGVVGGTAGGHDHPGEVNVSGSVGDHSNELSRWASEGRQFKTVIIVMPSKDGKGSTITLTGEVTITGYSISAGDVETWSLQFGKAEYSRSLPQAQPRA
jgi:hypothetical protein